MFFPKCKKCCHRCGGISPVKATDDMTQPVGQRDGQLYTQPVAAAEGITGIEDTEEIVAEVDEEGKASLYLAQEVSNKLSRALVTPASAPAEQKVVTVDTNGDQKMETYRKIEPIFKTETMTQSVGVDASGRLFTQPGGGGGGGGSVNSVNGYTGDVVLEASDIQTSGSETVEQDLQDIHEALANIPGEYIKRASVSGNTLTLTKQNDDTVVFNPQGGGAAVYNHLLRIYMTASQTGADFILELLSTSSDEMTLTDVVQILRERGYINSVIPYINRPKSVIGVHNNDTHIRHITVSNTQDLFIITTDDEETHVYDMDDLTDSEVTDTVAQI